MKKIIAERFTKIMSISKEIKNVDFHKDFKNKFGDEGRKDWFFLIIEYLDNEIGLKDKKILDIGCGNGLHSVIFALYGAKVVGIDMNKERLSMFMKFVERLRYLNIKMSYGSALDLPIRTEKCDIVFCNQFISHVSNLTTAMKEAKRVLRNNGFFIISDTNRETLSNQKSLKKIYKRVDKKIRNITLSIVEQRNIEKEYNLSKVNMKYLSEIVMGMDIKQIYYIVDVYSTKGNITETLNSIKVKFKYRHPQTGYYYERFFTPEEIKERMIKNGFKNVKIDIPMGFKLNKIYNLINLPIIKNCGSKIFLPTYIVSGKKVEKDIKSNRETK